MKMKVREALQLRNSLEEKGNRLLLYRSSEIEFGSRFEDETDMTNPEKEYFPTKFTKMSQKLTLLRALNVALAEFNATTGITRLVHQIKDDQVLIEMLNEASRHKAYIRNRKGSDGKIVVEKFVPFMSRDTLRSTLKALKEEVRHAQAEIDKLNGQEIELPFSEDDLLENEEVDD